MNQKFKIGQSVRVVSESVWKNKEGKVHSIISENGCYRIVGLEMFLIAFDETELVAV